MNIKNKTLVCLFMAFILVLQVSPVSAQDEMPPHTTMVVSDEPSTEDANWPIVKKETLKRQDPKTGRNITETIVVRQHLLNPKQTNCASNVEFQFDSVAAATCQYDVTIEDSRTIYVGGGAVTSVVKAFARKYCNTANGDCDYVKMTKVQVYWKRTSTRFGVINATSYMGCVGGLCQVCSSGNSFTRYIAVSAPFTPSWNGLRSLVYSLTAPTDMPIMTAFEEQAGYPTAGNDSTATAPRSSYLMSNTVIFHWP